MAGSTYQPNYSGVGRLLRSDMMRGHMVSRAERVAAFARATAPVYGGRDSDPHRGRYKAMIAVTSRSDGGVKHNRAEAQVVASAPEARIVEFGTIHQPGHHTMRNALYAAAGD